MADNLSDTSRQRGYGGLFSIDKEQISCTLKCSHVANKEAETEGEGEFNPGREICVAIPVDFLWGVRRGLPTMPISYN